MAVLRANLLLEELTGTLSGQAVRGNADIAVQDQNLTVKTLRLNAGEARLEADGSLAQRWDLRWTLNAPELKSLVPGLSGGVASTGALSGSRDRPRWRPTSRCEICGRAKRKSSSCAARPAWMSAEATALN